MYGKQILKKLRAAVICDSQRPRKSDTVRVRGLHAYTAPSRKDRLSLRVTGYRQLLSATEKALLFAPPSKGQEGRYPVKWT